VKFKIAFAFFIRLFLAAGPDGTFTFLNLFLQHINGRRAAPIGTP